MNFNTIAEYVIIVVMAILLTIALVRSAKYDTVFWNDALMRTMNTWFQTLVGTIGSTTVYLSEVDWRMALSAATMAAFMALAMRIGGNTPTGPKRADYTT